MKKHKKKISLLLIIGFIFSCFLLWGYYEFSKAMGEPTTGWSLTVEEIEAIKKLEEQPN